MSGERRPRLTAGSSFLTSQGEVIGIGPLRVSRRRLRRARGRAQADFAAAGTLVRQSVGRVRGQDGNAAGPPIDHRPDGSLVSPPLRAPVQRRPAPGRNGTVSPLAAIKERWHDAVREGKLAAKEKESAIRAEYERRVRHDPRLHAQHHGVLPPPQTNYPDTPPQRP